MSTNELAQNLPAMTDEQLDAAYGEMKAESQSASTACMANGGWNDTVHHHSQDAAIRDACIQSCSTNNLFYWEYKRRGIQSPQQREFDAEIQAMFA